MRKLGLRSHAEIGRLFAGEMAGGTTTIWPRTIG